MDTQRINNQDVNSDNNSEKNSKLKNTTIKGAQFASAVGVGVAGTMAANAMNATGEDSEVISEEKDTSIDPITSVPEETQQETIAEPVTDFNPEDIVIDVDDIVVDDDKTDATESETEENNDNDEAILEHQPIIEIESDINDVIEHTAQSEEEIIDIDSVAFEVMYGGPDGWVVLDDDSEIMIDDEHDEIFPDYPEDLLGESYDPDILDDLLA